MTQPYISKGPDPVEAAGFGNSKELVTAGNKIPLSAAPYSTIDTLVAQDKLTPELEQVMPTYNPQSLGEATGYFRSAYIAKTAEYTGKTNISDLANSRVLDFDRSELSRIVNDYGIKDYLLTLQESRDGAGEKYERDVAASIFDPIVRRVFREAISGGYFGLKEATDRFKDIYVNNLAEDMGISGASAVLGVSERTVRNRMESYESDKRNDLRFPDDCKPGSIDDVAGESSTSKQALEEEKLWQQSTVSIN